MVQQQKYKTAITGTRRREFLKFAGLAAAGSILPGFRLPQLPGATIPNDILVYVGTYTTGKSEGIYLFRLDLSSRRLWHYATTSHVINPSFLALAPSRRYLYAVNEVGDFGGKKTGAISSFAVDQNSGQLRLLNQQATLGSDPCYVDVDAAGRFVLVANYTGGNVSVFPVQADGSLGEATEMKQYAGSGVSSARQEGPHAHCIVLDPANRFAYSCDLGTDRIMIFRFDAQHGKLLPGDSPFVTAKPGAGPRHLAFHPTGEYVFVISELNSTVTVFKRDPVRGSLQETQTLSTLPKHFTGANTGADIHVSPDGRFVYCSNRGDDSIASFAFDARARKLTPVGHTPTQGSTPRNFAVDPTGRLLLVANQKSDNIVVFSLDKKTGRLNSTGQTVEVPAPVCLKFMASFS